MIIRGTKVKPRTYWEIEEITRNLRKYYEADDMVLFPIVKMVEAIAREGFQVVGNNEIGNNDGLTYPDSGIIQIREDIYYSACDGDERARDTMAHELGHFILHGSTSMARSNVASVVGPLMDSEWQADEFSGLLLAPTHIIAGRTAADVTKRCGIPLQTAINRVKKAKYGPQFATNLPANTDKGTGRENL